MEKFPRVAFLCVDADETFWLKARDTKARQNLLKTLCAYPDSIPTACKSIEKKINPPATAMKDQDPAKRILKYIPFVDHQFADDLRGAILAKGPRDPVVPIREAA